MSSFEPTYKIEKPPVEAMIWDEYEHIILSDWQALLNEDPPANEPKMQEYLEKHPSMVPGTFNMSGGESGHYPCFTALISQPILPSYGGPIPDFMWLSKNSEDLEPVLIEIEAPGKRWFTSTGEQTSQFTQALNQIAQWRVWFNEPSNVAAFKSYYLLDQERLRELHFQPTYVLIYGRRNEANARPELIKKRAYLAPDIHTRTYDRLNPNPKAAQLICLKMTKNERFKVVSVPPTLKWIPSLAQDRARMVGLDEVINNNSLIPVDRRHFLIRRLQYWNQWASQGMRGGIHSGDAE